MRAEKRIPFPLVQLLVAPLQRFIINLSESEIAARLGGFMKDSNELGETCQSDVTRLSTMVVAKRARNLGGFNRVRLDGEGRG